MTNIFEQGSFKDYSIYSLREARSPIYEFSQYYGRKTTVFISHKHDDLDDLHQCGDDQNEDQHLQEGQVDDLAAAGEFQQAVVDQRRTGRGDGHDEDHRAGHAHGRAQPFGNAQKGADPEEAGQHEVVDQRRSDGQFEVFHISSPSPFFRVFRII